MHLFGFNNVGSVYMLTSQKFVLFYIIGAHDKMIYDIVLSKSSLGMFLKICLNASSINVNIIEMV